MKISLINLMITICILENQIKDAGKMVGWEGYKAGLIG